MTSTDLSTRRRCSWGSTSEHHQAAARLSDDELTIYFMRLVPGGFAIYVATRTALDAPFGTATMVPGLNKMPSNQLYPTVTADGLHAYFTSASGVRPVYGICP